MMATPRTSLTAVAAVLTVGLLAGCSTDDSGGDNASDVATDGGSLAVIETPVELTPVANLKVGDCIVDLDAEAEPEAETSSATATVTATAASTTEAKDSDKDADKGSLALEYEVVDCTDKHNAEVYGTTELKYKDYPGQEYTQSDANKYCLSQFRKYHGGDGTGKGLSLSYLTPTRESWEQKDDRTVVCVVVSPEKELTGSLKGTGV